MLNITFQNTTYTFDTGDFKMQYFDSGDLHGNDNFRAQNSDITIYEALRQIDATLLQSALAASINDTPVPLTEKITKDCTLDVITINDAKGKSIYHQSLAFLIAQAIYTLDIKARLATLSISDTQCCLQFIVDDSIVCDADLFDRHLEKIMKEPAAIQIINGFQKEMLVETYPSLTQPYAKTFLAQYDDYDFVTIAARQNFVLPIQENALLVTNPERIQNYALSHSLNQNIYTITATHI